MNIKLALTLILSLNSMRAFGFSFSDWASQVKHSIHIGVQTSASTVSLGSNSYAEYGIKPSVGFFPLPQVELHANYFAVFDVSGSSNLNGLGFGGKYYFPTAGSTVLLKSLGTSIISSPDKAYYAGLEFLIRDLKTSTFTLNFTGYNLLLGGDWHFGHRWLGNFEASYAKMSNALGSAKIQTMNITTIGLAIGYKLN